MRLLVTTATFAALILGPVALAYVALALIEALTRTPITFVIIGAALVFGGTIAWAATEPRPLRIEDEEHLVITSPLFEMRLKR